MMFNSADSLILRAGATIDIAIWSTTEQGLAITAGSLATLRPLFRRIAAKLGWSTVQSGMPAAEEGPNSSIGHRNTTGRGRKEPADHSVSLVYPATIMMTTRRRPKTSKMGGLKLGDGYPGNFKTTITSGRKSIWGSKGPRTDNESEEELRMEGAKGDMTGVKIKSFSITEENA